MSCSEELFSGIIEMHVHAEPDTREGWWAFDQLSLAREFARRRYRAVLFKSHDLMTCDTAVILRSVVPGLEIFGGIALNRTYGIRVNPAAVTAALRTTGRYCRCVWLPTSCSVTDCRGRNEPGIPVVDEYGRVLPEVRKVMELCAEADIMLASGHSAPEECVRLAEAAREVGLAKMVITHCSQSPRALSLSQAEQCLEYGAFLEHSVLAYFKGSHALLERHRSHEQTTMRRFADYIRLAPERQFLSTDLGQSLNPHPVEGLHFFIRSLYEEGLSEETLAGLVKRIPAWLLGLDD